jgi:hypothetical protein
MSTREQPAATALDTDNANAADRPRAGVDRKRQREEFGGFRSSAGWWRWGSRRF